MRTSPRGIEDLVLSEALKTRAYRDSAGVWTIGVGHTASAGPPKPVAGMVITEAEAKEILARDLAKFEARVDKVFPSGVPQNVYDGAVSFVFNTGSTTASWFDAYKAGRMEDAERRLKLWNKAGGKVSQGLINRRRFEADLIFRGKYRSAPTDPVLRRGDGITSHVTVAYANAIKSAQKLLASHGYNPGIADGMFGEMTEAMTKRFQTKRHLVADGVIGPLTWAELRKTAPVGVKAVPPPPDIPAPSIHQWDDPDAMMSGRLQAPYIPYPMEPVEKPASYLPEIIGCTIVGAAMLAVVWAVYTFAP
jgi:lysozyme